jgi:hypothetical protein
VYTGLTLRGIVVFNHDFHGIVERKEVFGFVAIKTEELRACVKDLVEKISLHRRAQIEPTNRKFVLLNIIQDVFVQAAGNLVLCAAKDETSVEFMGRMLCCNFLRKS